MKGPLQAPGGGICTESLVDMIGLLSVHSTAAVKVDWVYRPSNYD